MFIDIETDHFFIGIDTEIREEADDFVEDDRSDNSQRVCNDCRNDLCHQEVGIAIEKAVGPVRIDFYRSPEARSDGTPRAAYTVDAKGIEGVVIAQTALADGNGQIADDTADSTDIESRKGGDEPGSRRNDYETGDAA